MCVCVALTWHNWCKRINIETGHYFIYSDKIDDDDLWHRARSLFFVRHQRQQQRLTLFPDWGIKCFPSIINNCLIIDTLYICFYRLINTMISWWNSSLIINHFINCPYLNTDFFSGFPFRIIWTIFSFLHVVVGTFQKNNSIKYQPYEISHTHAVNFDLIRH